MSQNINCKLVFLGDSAVGKSCIVNRFTNNEFCSFQESTIGAAFSTSTIEANNKKIKFEIWDTAGQERYRSLAPMYYRGAKFAVVVYDITSMDSFKGAKSWIIELAQQLNPSSVIILVGNKIDLEEQREVSKDLVQDFVENQDILYIESSAKSGKNIREIFENLALNLPSDENAEFYQIDDRNILNENTINNRKNFNCC